jgi:hypothetical protein
LQSAKSSKKRKVASLRLECFEDTEDERIEDEVPTGTQRTVMLDSRLDSVSEDSDSVDDFTAAESPLHDHNRHQVCMKTLLRIV